MSADAVRDAYARRATEYIERFGSMESVHPSDRALVRTWACGLTGPVLDVGCGPGQWTQFLGEQGLAVTGVDRVPEFVEHARWARPGLPFQLGSAERLDAATASVGGVLAWYSLIHHAPSAIHVHLREFARVLRRGGGLAIGFFEGDSVERFAHSVTDAYRWPVRELRDVVESAGFEVVETHTRTGPGHRPHGAIVAERSGTAA